MRCDRPISWPASASAALVASAWADRLRELPLPLIVVDDPLTAHLVAAIMAEARAIGEALGIDIAMTIDERNAITRKLGAFKTSMLQDVEAGRSLEVEALLGAPYELAQRTGVAALSLGMLYGMARQLDANLEAARRATKV